MEVNMKKGKSRNKRKKTRSRLLWIAIAVIGIAAVISAVCVAGMLATKENAWKTPEELLVEYMDHIPKQEYEEMYAMLHIEASGNVSQEDFVTRNSAIYEGIEVQNMAVQIIAYDEEQMAVTYQTSFDTVAGTIGFENEALFLKGEDGYKLVWDDSMIFPNLTSTDKVRVSTTQAVRGEILDRNGRVLAGKGIASSVGIVPGKLENREEAIAQIAELLETTLEAIEKKLSAQWVKDDSFVPIKTIPRVEEIELMKIEPDEEVLKEKEYDRSRIVIATKAAHVPNKGRTFDNSPEFLKQSVEDALKRLQTDYIDIFYIHFPDKSTPKNEAVAALHELKEAGKIRAVGVSNFTLEQLKEANTDGYVDVVEDKYSLIHRQAEKELFPYLEKNKISFVPYFLLASGLLTGKYERGQEKQFGEGDPRKSNPDFQGERFKEILAAVDILRPIAKRYQATPAQLVLAWYMKNPRVSVVIPGAKRPEQVSDNVQALDLHLSSEDYQTIDEAFHGF